MKTRKPFSLVHEQSPAIVRAFESLAGMGFQVVHADPKPHKPGKPRKAHELAIATSEHEPLRQMAAHSGWQEVGGRAIREAGKYQTGGKVIGRTVWVGKPEWARNLGLNAGAIKAAVEKAIAGDWLGKRQETCIRVMLAEIRRATQIQPEETECPF